MRRDLFGWAPPTVRHLFRAARFGAHCPHGAGLHRVDDLVWASACGGGCDARERRPLRSSFFALGHHREVPGPYVELRDASGFRAFMAGASPVGEDLVREAVPAPLVDLACALRVQAWSSARFGEGFAAVGFVLGLPVCALAPYVHRALVLAPGKGSR